MVPRALQDLLLGLKTMSARKSVQYIQGISDIELRSMSPLASMDFWRVTWYPRGTWR
jgi:hypothetical protein